MSKYTITLPVRIIKQAALELGMTDVHEDDKILAALDDYFKTLNDGQFSPLSGENNNASNSTEVYNIAKKHNVDPGKLMKYLGDVAIFDKFQALSINESTEYVVEMASYNSGIINKVLRMMFSKGYDKHVLDAINTYYKRVEDKPDEESADNNMVAMRVASAYGIDLRLFLDRLSKFNKEAHTMENKQHDEFSKILESFESKITEIAADIDEGSKKSSPEAPKRRDFVAKNLGQNKGGAHKSKADYKRHNKHKGRGLDEANGYNIMARNIASDVMLSMSELAENHGITIADAFEMHYDTILDSAMEKVASFENIDVEDMKAKVHAVVDVEMDGYSDF